MEIPNKLTIDFYEKDGGVMIQIHSEVEGVGEEGMTQYLQCALESLIYKEPALKRIK